MYSCILQNVFILNLKSRPNPPPYVISKKNVHIIPGALVIAHARGSRSIKQIVITEKTCWLSVTYIRTRLRKKRYGI
jgi:hypothetical protein